MRGALLKGAFAPGVHRPAFFRSSGYRVLPPPWETMERAAMHSQCLHPEKGGSAT